MFYILLFIFFFILTVSTRKTSAFHYQHEACSTPRSCPNGPNITYPFYTNLQPSYCGLPEFGLNCTQSGYPLLQLPGNDFIAENIFYHNQSLRVYDFTFLGATLSYQNGSFSINNSFSDNRCLHFPRNTTLPTPQFYFSEFVTRLHLLENCTNSLSSYNQFGNTVICNGTNRPVAIFGEDENLRNGLESCSRHVVAPVEQIGNIYVALRRGFVLNYTAADCRSCEISGGRCGFDSVTSSFRCFCRDRPRSVQCLPIVEGGRSKLVMLIVGLIAALTVSSVLIVFIFIKVKKRSKFTTTIQAFPGAKKAPEKVKKAQQNQSRHFQIAPEERRVKVAPGKVLAYSQR